ncbi:hypothetical protein [Mycobacterium colombiense]|uniref:hypothetical protein n=1 Tax=Mycobacterium colombiense TaxID=339268 RepID=UPI001150C1DF|nr:hypothetical protein [Mycobacterium colombiense]
MSNFDFPVLDAPRLHANNEFGRFVIDTIGVVDAYLEETDYWTSMPVRLVHDQANGCHLELGPYSLDRCDIDVLRGAIAAYDEATRPLGQPGSGK